MPVVSVDNLPLYELAIFGYDGTNYRVVSINTSGQLVLALATGQALQANSYGWISGVQQRDPLRFGLSGVVRELLLNASLAAGVNTINSTLVPTGEYHVLTNVSMQYVGTPPTSIELYILSGGTLYNLFMVATPVSATFYDRQGWWPLAPGERLQMYISGATAGDNARFYLSGFRVDIDQ